MTDRYRGQDRKPDKPYHVNLWGCKPGDDDACHTGEEYASRDEAEQVYGFPCTEFPAVYFRGGDGSELWVELDGPDVHYERCLRQADPALQRRVAEREACQWRNERAMQAGMGMGVQAYNDAMGYGHEPYDPSGDDEW